MQDTHIVQFLQAQTHMSQDGILLQIDLVRRQVCPLATVIEKFLQRCLAPFCHDAVLSQSGTLFRTSDHRLLQDPVAGYDMWVCQVQEQAHLVRETTSTPTPSCLVSLFDGHCQAPFPYGTSNDTFGATRFKPRFPCPKMCTIDCTLAPVREAMPTILVCDIKIFRIDERIIRHPPAAGFRLLVCHPKDAVMSPHDILDFC